MTDLERESVERVVAHTLANVDHDFLREMVGRYLPVTERQKALIDKHANEGDGELIAEMSGAVITMIARRLNMLN